MVIRRGGGIEDYSAFEIFSTILRLVIETLFE